MFYSDEKTNKKQTSSFFLKPGTDNDTHCCICGKPDNTPQLPHRKRYGGYICSVKCFKAQKEKTQKEKTVSKTKTLLHQRDVELVKSKLKSRKHIINLIDQLSYQRDEIINEMEEKHIYTSCASYREKFFKVEILSVNGSKCIQHALETRGKEISSEYAKEYADIVLWLDFYEQELDCVEKFLTSGKCIRYSRSSSLT